MDRKLLVCDLDNTLYDWVSYFVPAFYAMIDEVVAVTNCDREQLLDDFREIHRFHHDSEHPFSLLETKTIRHAFPNQSRLEIARNVDRAFHAFNSTRKAQLKLYPGVLEALDNLVAAGIVLVAHTESKLYAVVDRLTRLDLTKYFKRIYCRERPTSSHPDPELGQRWLDSFPMHKVVELSHHQRKPDPDVLIEICRTERIDRKDCGYVGDSPARDLLMAKKANVYSIWAKYGSTHDPQLYERLVRISHWTPADIEREMRLKEEAKEVKADFVLTNSFAEILDAPLFRPSRARRSAAL